MGTAIVIEIALAVLFVVAGFDMPRVPPKKESLMVVWLLLGVLKRKSQIQEEK